MNKKYLCIHGHFYQPPRENAWLERIEYQESAAPYHDWNERINDECYGPNGVSRILNDEQRIVDIVNNYAKMSFNFGPTLLNWMEAFRPKTYSLILEADRLSMERFGGHGSAMAQVYNHIIMPLANRRDKETQVKWGIEDFVRRFARRPEGMWLAETAVDTETLEVLAENDIAFTILAPRQAKRFRKLDEERWVDGIDSKNAYLYRLPSGRTISLFFYDGDRSQSVAFNGLLEDGRTFAKALLSGFDQRDDNQLVHIATDGESYGHHHRNGDMALAYCMHHIEDSGAAVLTNYSQYLELAPPQHEVEIHENSSWSCVHGVERWKADCGCNTGGRPEWNQQWRAPLREALNWLRDELSDLYEERMGGFHPDPWTVRDRYIEVAMQHTEAKARVFLDREFDDLSREDCTSVMRLFEMQRQCQLMFTSCAWFFDEFTGIETVQVLQYACRALQIASGLSERPYKLMFRQKLAVIRPNNPDYATGDEVFTKLVEPSQLTLTKIGMHFAVSSLFAEEPDEVAVFNYKAKSNHFRRIVQGGQRLVVGRTHVRSRVTFSEKSFSYVVLYLGQHHLIGKAFPKIPVAEYHSFVEEVIAAFRESNISLVVELFQRYPEQRSFSFFDMFKDEQISMLGPLVEEGQKRAADSYDKINNRNYNLLNVMHSSGLTPPRILVQNLEMVLNYDLRQIFNSEKPKINIPRLRRVIEDIKKWDFRMDHADMNYLCTAKINDLVETVGPLTTGNYKRVAEVLTNLQNTLELVRKIGIHPDLNQVQDVVFTHIRRLSPDAPDKVRARLYRFAEFVNIDVGAVTQHTLVTP